MADERSPIEGSGGEEFERAARRTLQRAQKAVESADQAAQEAQKAARAINRRARTIAQRLSVQTTGGGRYYVEEQLSGEAQAAQVAMREGRQRPSYFRSQEAAQNELKTIALERARAERQARDAAQEAAQASRQQAAASRQRARAERVTAEDERGAVAGNAREFERIARQHAQRMADALDPEQKRKFEAAREPLPPERQGAAAAELEKATEAQAKATEAQSEGLRRQVAQLEALTQVQEASSAESARSAALEEVKGSHEDAARQREQTRSATVSREGLEPRSAGGTGRDVVRHIDEQEARAEARIAKQQEVAETRRLIAAEARERSARDHAATVKLQEVRGGGAGGGGGGRPPAPPGGPSGPDDPRPPREVAAHARAAAQAAGEQARLAEAARLNEAAQARLDARMGRSASAVQMWGTQVGLVDQGMRKHGALTTEFISAAVRGEASYREWGYQIGATAAKFAGWTAVSIPVFAAMEGVRRIGEGAIASSSGVEQLQRVLGDVDSSQAQAAFRGLSSQFNMPIAEVSDAIFGMGQVFHNLPDAVDAATAALYSFKVGGVDVETSTRNLNAIATGFGVQSGGELLRFFDQINQAQNQFGITIANTEAGVAKAAGTFRNAGGDFSYLLALIATGQRATGRSGENIGTAVQRSVGFIQRPQNQQALSEFGIDTSRGIEAIYSQAFDVAQRLSGEGLQRLATALSSPQYASYFVPILQNRDLFQRLRAGTSPEASRGSATRELENVLGQLDERIAQVGNNFERLGSSLGQSGFTLPLVGAVEGMNSLLTASSGVLAIFNSLPAPLRLALAVMVQMRGLAAILRRTGAGEALQGTSLDRLAPYLIESPERRGRRAISKGINDSIDAARDEQQRAVGTAYRDYAAAQRAQEIAQQRVAQIQQHLASRAITEAQATDARAEAYAHAERAADRALESSAQATGALRQTAQQELLQAQLKERLRGVSHGDRDRVAADFARENGLYVPPSLRMDVPLSEKARRVDELAFDPDSGITGGDTEQRPARRLRDDRRALAARMRAGIGTYQGIARDSTLLTAATIGADDAVRAAGRGIIASGKGLAGLGRSLAGAGRELLGMIGPLEIILAGLLIIPQVYERAKRAVDDRTRSLERTTVAQPTTARGLRAQHTEAVKEANRHTTLGDLETDVGDLLHGDFGSVFGDNAAIRRQNANRAIVNAQNHLADAQRRAAGTGRARAGLTMDSVFASVDDDYRAFNDGRITLAELRERTDTRLKEVNEGVGGAGAKDNARQRINARFGATGGGKDFYRRVFGSGALDEVSSDIYDDQIAGLEALMGAGQATDRQVQQHQAALLAVMAQARGKGDRANRERYATASQEFVESLNSSARDDLDRALGVAKGQNERNAAYRRYFEQTTGRAGLNRLLGTRRDQRRDAEQGLADSQAREQFLLQQRDEALGRGDLRGAYRAFQAIGGENSQQRGYKATIERTKREAAAIRKSFGDTAEGRRQFREAMRREEYEDQRAFREAQTGVQAGRQDAGAPRIRYQLRRIGDEIRRAVRLYGRRSKEVLSLINEQQDLQNQMVDEQETTIDSIASYNAARAGTDAGEAAANMRGLQQKLAHRVANPQRYSANDVRDVRTQILQAQKQQAEQARQDAVDLIGARYDYLSSLTDNPVELARLQEQQAGATLAQGGFKNAAERYQALAAVNNARRQREQAVSDRRIENLDYEHDIGKLTDDAYIRSLEAVMGDMKKGSEARRQLRMRIGRLKHDIDQGGDFELNVGDIRLPSLYEIRRAVTGRQRGQSVTQNRNNVTINVSKDTDMGAFASALETQLSGSGRATLRSVGMR